VFSELLILSIYASLLGLIALPVTPIIGLYWYYRATKNIHSFGAKKVTSPRMAVIWWFVPFVQLWKPYFVSQQIWKASDTGVKLIEGTEWKTSPSSNLIKIAWLLSLASVVGNAIVNIFLDTLTGEDQFSYSLFDVNDPILKLFKILFHFTMIISLIFYIPIIRTISVRQQLKSGQV